MKAKKIWKGAMHHVIWPEGPHLYKKDGYYYLKRYLIFGRSRTDADAVAGNFVRLRIKRGSTIFG